MPSKKKGGKKKSSQEPAAPAAETTAQPEEKEENEDKSRTLASALVTEMTYGRNRQRDEELDKKHPFWDLQPVPSMGIFYLVLINTSNIIRFLHHVNQILDHHLFSLL